MSEIVDARGLSCPQPVLMTRKALSKASGEKVTVQVDTKTQVESCSRAAEKLGWKGDCTEQANFYELTFTR